MLQHDIRLELQWELFPAIGKGSHSGGIVNVDPLCLLYGNQNSAYVSYAGRIFLESFTI